MTSPGWYPDPDGGHQERFWNGTAWTVSFRGPGQVWTPPRKSPAIFGIVIMLIGIGAAIVMAFVVKPSLQVFGTEASCGTNATQITIRANDARAAAADSSDDTLGLASEAIEQCISQAHDDLVWAGIALVGGLVIGGLVDHYERYGRNK